MILDIRLPAFRFWVFCLFFFIFLFLWVRRQAEVQFLDRRLIVIDARGEQDKCPSRERRHVVTTGDLNGSFQSFTVTVQQCNSVVPLTAHIQKTLVLHSVQIDSFSHYQIHFNLNRSAT